MRYENENNSKDELKIQVFAITLKGDVEVNGKIIKHIEGGFGENCKIITDRDIAIEHDITPSDIRKLINRNIKRFRDGIDYIDLTNCSSYDDQQLQSFGYTKMQIGKAEHIYILSERGYSKIIKIMDTDLAWEIYDKMLDGYFTMREEIKQRQDSYMISDPIERAKAWIIEETERQKLRDKIKNDEPLVKLAEKRLDICDCSSITDVTKSMELKRGQITKWAKDKGYLHKTNTEVNKLGDEYFKLYCKDGIHSQIGITKEGLKLINDSLVEIREY